MEYKELPSGIIVPADMKRYPIAVDLFAGAGGFSLGFIQAGWEVVAAVEWSYAAAHTYLLNLGSYPCNIHFTDDEHKKGFNTYLEKQLNNSIRANGRKNGNNLWHSDFIDMPGTFICGSGWIASKRANGKYFPPVKNFWLCDIKQLTGQMILDTLGLQKGDIDCVMGGPPCQGFSRANTKNNKHFDPRNYLVFEFARLVCELHPKTFVMEEVPQIATKRTPNGNRVIDELCMIFDRGDYMNYESAMQALGFSKEKGRNGKLIIKTKEPAKKKTNQLSLLEE